MKGLRLGIALLAVCVTGLTAAAAQAAPGDVYVVDRQGDNLWKWGPAGGEATSLSPFPGSSPYGMKLGPDGFLYVADEDNGVYRVDPATGAKTLYAPTAALGNPIDVAFLPDGRMLVADYNTDTIKFVDRATGALSDFSNPPAASTGYNSLAVLRDGTVFVSDENESALYRIAPDGTRTTVAENDLVLQDADGLFVTPDERFLYVGSFDRLNYVRYDLKTGARSILPTPGSPYGTAQLADGRLLFSDGQDSHIEIVSTEGVFANSFSTDVDLDSARGIVVEPEKCAGLTPTVIGTNAAETLKGSSSADVILARGGKDVVTGLQGNDVVCGGTGKDILRGGPGRDKLLGQGGKDKLVGGKGKDKLKGGAGKDVQKQ